MLRVLTSRAKDKNYQLRSVLLLGVEHLHAAISSNALETQLVPAAVEMASDPVRATPPHHNSATPPHE
eukprot:4378633-Pleurochrysis_carterae.AAC.1